MRQWFFPVYDEESVISSKKMPTKHASTSIKKRKKVTISGRYSSTLRQKSNNVNDQDGSLANNITKGKRRHIATIALWSSLAVCALYAIYLYMWAQEKKVNTEVNTPLDNTWSDDFCCCNSLYSNSNKLREIYFSPDGFCNIFSFDRDRALTVFKHAFTNAKIDHDKLVQKGGGRYLVTLFNIPCDDITHRVVSTDMFLGDIFRRIIQVPGTLQCQVEVFVRSMKNHMYDFSCSSTGICTKIYETIPWSNDKWCGISGQSKMGYTHNPISPSQIPVEVTIESLLDITIEYCNKEGLWPKDK